MVSKHMTYQEVISLAKQLDKWVEKRDYDYREGRLDSDQISMELDRILPKSLVDYFVRVYQGYYADLEKVNSKGIVNNLVLSLGHVLYSVNAKSEKLVSVIHDRCKKLLSDNCIMFPIISAVDSYVPYYVTYNDREEMNQFVDSLIYSFISQVMVGKLQLTIIDSQNHGESAVNFYNVMNKFPYLFGGQFLTESESISDRLCALGNKVESILQDKLGTEYDTVFDYVEQKPDCDLDIELVVLYDFPYGLTDNDMSVIIKLLKYGARCGIYMVIAKGQNMPRLEKLDESQQKLAQWENGNDLVKRLFKIREEMDQVRNRIMIAQRDGDYEKAAELSYDRLPRLYQQLKIEEDEIDKIGRDLCVGIQLNEDTVSFCGLPYRYSPMPDKDHFDAFMTNYTLVYEILADKADVFNPVINSLIESVDDIELEEEINSIKNITEESEKNLGKVPEAEKVFPQRIVIGKVHYPVGIFEGSHGYGMIAENFSDGENGIQFPLVLDTQGNMNLLIEGDNDNVRVGQEFIHNVMWSFLSAMPVTKLNISVFDCERKGNSITPFLEIKKKNSELFDRDIYTSSDGIDEKLRRLNSQIDDCIQNKLGTKYKSIIEYNKDNPARGEVIQLLVINDFPSGFDSRSIDLLLSVLKNGNKCGIYTVIHYNKDIKFSRYDNVDEYIEQIKKCADIIEIKDYACYLHPYHLEVDGYADVSISAEKFAADYFERANAVKSRGVAFQDILDTELFERNAGDSLEIPVGIGDGGETVAVSFGKGQSHHALIAGATGSGKSTLLHTLIMSAMLHYSPDELNLYLMDFKSGTEFKVYDSYRLPHVKCLALDAMQEFGESILEELVNEMNRRSEKFKGEGVSKLGEYVKKSGMAMPRILVVMDEFQILFNDSSNREVAKNCAELAKRIVTEGRAFGIHLLMATQSTKVISGLSLVPGTVDQMRIRIGLKCGDDDARYLFKDNNDVKALEMMKGPIGTAVMNPDYAEEENIGFRVVYCDSDTQDKMLRRIDRKFTSSECTTQIFEGNRTKNLLNVFEETDTLTVETKNVEVEVGELIKVAPPLKLVFDKKKKHNILVCGSDEKMADNIFNLLSLSILLKSKTSKMYCVDGDIILGEDNLMPFYGQFQHRFVNRFSLAVTRGDIIEFINEIYDVYKQKKKGKNDTPIFIGIKNFQFLDIVKQMMKGAYIDESEYLDDNISEDAEDKILKDNHDSIPFFPETYALGAQSSAEELSISEKLIKLIDDGSAYGIYFILTCSDYQDISENMYHENVLSKFPEKFVFALNDVDAGRLIEEIKVTSLRDNTVYYSDSIRNMYQVKPYVFPNAEELEQYLDSLEG